MRSDRTFLRHILDCIDAVESYVADGREAFLADRKSQDAVARNLEIIGEAVKNLSDDLTTEYPNIPWRQIAGMRDRLIHRYFTVSLELVWTVASAQLPHLRGDIVQILADLDPQPSP